MISLAESLIASVGIPAILAGKAKLRMGGNERILFAARMNSLIRQFMACREREYQSTSTPFDYDDVLMEITEFGSTSPELTAGLDPETAAEVVADVQRAVAYLDSELPKATIKTMTGIVNDRPSEVRIAKFRRIWDVAARPMVVFEALADLSLMTDQVRALQALFPSIYETAAGKPTPDGGMAGGSVDDATLAHQSKDLKWMLPHSRDVVLATLLQSRSVAVSVGRKLQQQAEESRQKAAQPKPQPNKGTALPKSANGIQTQTQRAANM